MRRGRYRDAVKWIALNDDAGDVDALDEIIIRTYLSAALVADIFEVDLSRVARDVARVRRRERRQEDRTAVREMLASAPTFLATPLRALKRFEEGGP